MTIINIDGRPIGEPDIGKSNYEMDYFSSSQIQVMMGDILLDSAISLSYELRQNKTPVYGYANQYFTFVADGQVFVSGSLVIAFKEAGYLLYPIKRFHNLAASSTWASPRYDVQKVKKQGIINNTADLTKIDMDQDPFTTIAKQARRKKTMRANVEQMFAWEQMSKDTDPKLNAKGNANYNRFLTELGSLEDDAFEDWAEVFEDSLWYGSDIQNSFMRDKINSKNATKDQDIDNEFLLSHRRPDQYPPVDIWIVYGNTDDASANHTVQKILDVSFTGCSKGFAASGEPVYEAYSFLAKNLV
jgi:hypothetical protein